MQFVEFPHFTRWVEANLSDEEYRQIQEELIKNPHKGDLIPLGQSDKGEFKMKDKHFQELVESIGHAGEYMQGRRKPARVFRYTPANVKKIRLQMGLSQNQFAKALHISVNTLQNWEQGRCVPEGPAQVLLKIADKNPKALFEAIHQ